MTPAELTARGVRVPHEWTASNLGHGEWQCVYCLATNREIAVIGDPNHCPDAAKAKYPETHRLFERAALTTGENDD